MIVRGIDVSRWQGDIDWSLVASDGIKFAAIRATVGDYYKDPRFEENWNGARGSGIYVTPYAVIAWHRPVADQIEWFREFFGLRIPDIPVVLDIEAVQENMPVETMFEEAFSITQSTFGRPLIYSAAWCWNGYITSTQWKEYELLWPASYSVYPKLPNNWDDWLFWQQANDGSVYGVAGNVDIDEFNGDLNSLDAFVRESRAQYLVHARYAHRHRDLEGRIGLLEERVSILEGFKLSWPTEYHVTTQAFGNNPAYYGTFGLPGHEGLDMRAPLGSKIMACAAGTVYMVHDGSGGHNYGKHVRIDHGNGYKTVYAHLQEFSVSVGQFVKRGQVIGLANNTGNSAGSHLHLTLKKAGATEAGETQYPNDIVDPTPYML